MPNYVLEWRGEETAQAVREGAGRFLSRVGLGVEGEAKQELYKGHGVLNGTLRRSIHCAEEGYGWGGDDITPGAATPELGGRAAPTGSNTLTIEVGSGLKYALPVHQGHHSFEGYHYLTNALDKIKMRIASIAAEVFK
jgi:hypothetical protein